MPVVSVSATSRSASDKRDAGRCPVERGDRSRQRWPLRRHGGDVDTDGCPFVTEDSLANIYGAMVKVAWSDFEAGYVGHGMPDAAVFLRSAGLLREDGSRDDFGHKVYRRRKATP